MTWNEVKQKYPSQWVKLQILKSHEFDNKEYIDEMTVISDIDDDIATDELVSCKENEIVFHTDNAEIYSEIRNIFFSYRR